MDKRLFSLSTNPKVKTEYRLRELFVLMIWNQLVDDDEYLVDVGCLPGHMKREKVVPVPTIDNGWNYMKVSLQNIQTQIPTQSVSTQPISPQEQLLIEIDDILLSDENEDNVKLIVLTADAVEQNLQTVQQFKTT